MALARFRRAIAVYVCLALLSCLFLTSCSKGQAGAEQTHANAIVEDQNSDGVQDYTSLTDVYSTIYVSRQGMVDGNIENSLGGLYAAKEAGFDIVRLDVQFTNDKIPVLFHDETLGKQLKVYDENGNEFQEDKHISDLSFNDVNSYAYGSKTNRILTLDNALQVCKELGMGILLEFKDVTPLTKENMLTSYEMVAMHGMLPNTIWSVYSVDTGKYIIDIDATCEMGYIKEEISTNTIDQASELYTGKNKVWFCAYASHFDEFTEELHIYAAKKNVHFKMGSAYSIDDLLKYSDFEMIEVANIKHPAETVAAYKAVDTTRYITPSIERYSHVVVIGIDGAGAFFKDVNTPNFDRIFASGDITYDMIAPYPTNSSDGWGSMLYGASSAEHKIKNQIVRHIRYYNEELPSVFRTIHDSYPAAEIASVVGWTTINSGLIDDVNDVSLLPNQDKEESLSNETVVNNLRDYMQDHDPKFLFIHLDGVDHVGHEFGWGTSEYLTAIAEADQSLGEIYEIISSKGFIEDTLFIVTADHGGNDNGHGGDSSEERQCMFAVLGKNVIQDGQIVDIEPRDVASIILCALGIQQPENYSGRVPSGIWKDVGGEERPITLLSIETKRFMSQAAYIAPVDKFPEPLLNGMAYWNSFDNEPLGYSSDPYPSGYFGSAMDCNNYYCPANINWDKSWNSVSISFWINPSQWTNDPVVFSNKNWTSGSNAGIVIAQREKDILLNLGDGEGHRQDISFPIPSDYWGKWTHYTFVIDMNSMTIQGYWNFEEMFSESISDELVLDNIRTYDPFVIGQDISQNYTYNLHAMIDEVIIFNHALSEIDISALKEYYVR